MFWYNITDTWANPKFSLGDNEKVHTVFWKFSNAFEGEKNLSLSNKSYSKEKTVLFERPIKSMNI